MFPGGQTIHSLLNMPVKKGCSPVEDLSGIQLADLHNRLKKTKVLIIDEKGMIGLGRLMQINSRLKQAKPQLVDKPFSGISVLLFGDLR